MTESLKAVRRPRLAVRALILDPQDRLLLVNAYAGGVSDLWCAPGGGAEIGQSLPENLRREVREETGLEVSVGEICLVNEFHAPEQGFHQVEIFFRCAVTAGVLDPAWRDPDAVVSQRRFFSESELRRVRYKPGCLDRIAWGEQSGVVYDPLELLAK